MFMTCKYMGWDYETYKNQPVSFIELADLFRGLEAEEAKRSQRKWHRQT